MAGIYIHIPFCKQACVYCNFHFSTSLGLKDDLIKSILNEIELRHTYLDIKHIDSIYFGGGSPSLISAFELSHIFNKLTDYFTWDTNCEITLEANPDDISTQKIKDYLSIGINRMSIGIQSFQQADLSFMNRAHDAEQAQNCISIVRNAGIQNITIDLIYGSPTTTDEMWQDNLNKAILSDVSHISSYCLTVEERTALHHQISKNKIKALNEDQANRQFYILMEKLDESGFEHYEISNFAKPGHMAIHNTNYWQSKPYLGLGPSAHSFNGISRSWNVANNKKYIDSIAVGVVAMETEILTPENQYNEYIMTRLRTKFGVNIIEIEDIFGLPVSHHFQKEVNVFLKNEMVLKSENKYFLTKTGKLYADKIAMELFL